MNTYIPYMNINEPLSNSPIKTIEININIIQKNDGSGNFENNQSTINRFRNVITYVNSFYSNYAPSDKIEWVQELPNYDSRIRFSIGEVGQERIYFYQNTNAWDDTYVHENIEDFIETNYPERLEKLNLYIFGNPYNQNWAHASFPSWSNLNSHSWVVMKYWGSDVNDWAKSTLLAHELGHTLDLLHTYYGGGASAICNQLNENFLQDVFLVELPSLSNCPHTGNWNDNPYILNGDRITNNLLGGTSAQRYISPQQSGQMHRALALTSVRQYVKCEKSEVPLEIIVNQTWDFDIKLYQDLIINQGAHLTLRCNLVMHPDAKIIIMPGGLFTIDGGSIKTDINEKSPWQGIEVWGNSSASQYPMQGQPSQQGKLILNNATIENALCAVSLWKEGDYTKTGGIVQATNTIFRNNTKSVHIQPYRNFNPYFPTEEMDYLASFTNCTFVVDNDYLGTHNFYKHVDLNRVKGVKFNSCNFSLADNVQSASPWNSAIASYSAGFSAMAPTGQTCSFSGFQSAIYAANTGMNTYSFFVNRALFDNNAIGINAKWMNNAAVINSTFNIGNGNYTAENCYYGIRLEQSSGFAIEENQFGKQESSPQANLIGISVVNSLGVEDIYRNTFAGLSAGNYAYGKNYMSNGIGGLSYTCNTNSDNYADIYVYGTTSEHGIQSLQGSFSQPAGNTFSPNATWNFYNGTRRLIGYYYNTNAAFQYPAFVEYVVREGVLANNACPSHYGGNNETLTLTASQKQALESEYLISMNRYDAVQSLYSNLTDGGDTEGSLNDIATAQSGDMWALRARLLGASPHVSQEVLLAVADHTEVFTEAAIFDILAANPDELRNNELIEYLGQKEIPLPEYMIDILRQVAEGTTYKTVLQMQMAKHSHDKARAAHDMLRSILNEESPDMIQLRNWLHNLGGLSAERQIVASFIQEGRYSEAIDLANTLPMVYALQGETLDEHNNFVAMLLMNQNMLEENRGLEDLTEDETAIMNDFAVNDNGLAGTLARSIVETISGQPFANCPSLQGESSYKSSAIVNPNHLAGYFGLSISVKPNPANSWTSFDFTLPEDAKDARIEIASPAGAVIESIPLSSIKGQKLFDTRKLSPGVYNCTLFAGAFSQTVKLIIQH